MEIRSERPNDIDGLRVLTAAAFKDVPHSRGTEAAIVDALRASGALTLSLVVLIESRIVGHVAFSPVTINDDECNWFGLGPMSVLPDCQGRGIGQALIRAGLDRLKGMDAGGCVVLGDPAYYRRFGFLNDPKLRYDGAPPEYFQRLAFGPEVPRGEVVYHSSFGPP